jgi:hypothetical protein
MNLALTVSDTHDIAILMVGREQVGSEIKTCYINIWSCSLSFYRHGKHIVLLYVHALVSQGSPIYIIFVLRDTSWSP